jgi:dTDP-4-amino-4,6-dideoxygalactose transaminase
MSNLARIQLGRYSLKDFEHIERQARGNYAWLSENLSDLRGIEVLWPDLPKGAVPPCLSLLVERQRDEFLRRLKALKYSVMAWPTLTQEVINRLDEFPEMEIIGRQILQIHLSTFRILRGGLRDYLVRLVVDFRRLAAELL